MLNYIKIHDKIKSKCENLVSKSEFLIQIWIFCVRGRVAEWPSEWVNV